MKVDKSASETSQTKEVFIKSAKIKDINEPMSTLDVKYHESIIQIVGNKRKDIGGAISREGDNSIHDDLRAAFKRLDIHLALISEIMKEEDQSVSIAKLIRGKDVEVDGLDKFKVTAFSIGGSGDGEGVTLIGQKILSTGKILNITTPFEKWEGSEYVFMPALAEAIESCKYEVQQYLEGKMAPPAQQELDLNEEEHQEAAAE